MGAACGKDGTPWGEGGPCGPKLRRGSLPPSEKVLALRRASQVGKGDEATAAAGAAAAKAGT